MKSPSHRVARTEAVLLSGLGLISAAHANAQSADQASSEPPRQIQQVVVTGTLIPTSPDAAAVPVTRLDAAQLQQTGVTDNALDMLRKAIPAFAGRSNAGTSNAQSHNQFTAGGSQIQLRNLPTLVLVDGERVADDAVAGLNGSKDFVDVSQIPAAALERVDVLTDGASSLYGSDAIGGVVNFILKHDYHGLTFGGDYGAASGDYSERSYFATGGADVGPVNITATASFSKTSPLWQYQRSFASPKFGVTPGADLPGVVGGGGYVLAPALAAPNVPTGTSATAASYAQLAAAGVYDPTTATALSNGFNYAPYAMLLQQQENEAFVGNVTSKAFFNGRVKAFGDVLVSRNKVDSTAWASAGQPFST
ncbi:MAG: TonB-dependent receptor plug domain-containing protein, partial [Steroidobacteraceae bacterium]